MSPILLPPREAGLAGGDPLLAVTGTKESQPRGLESVLEFNGIYFHDLGVIDKYRLTKISGFHALPDIRDAREVNPQAHGETAFPAFFGGRTIILEGRIEAHTIWKLRDMQQALRSAFADLTERPLIVRTPSLESDVQIMCRCIGFAMEDQQTNFSHFREFQITLRASDPRFTRYLETVYDAPYGVFDTFTTADVVDATNLIINPSAEVDVTGWDASHNSASFPAAVRNTTDARFGSASAETTYTATGNGQSLLLRYSNAASSPGRIAVTQDEQLYVRVFAKVVTTAGDRSSIQLRARFFTTLSGGTVSQDVNIKTVSNPVNDTWVELDGVVTVPANSAGAGFFVQLPNNLPNGVATTLRVDGLMVVRGGSGPDYFDGSLPQTTTHKHRWTGAAHASTSERFVGDALADNWSFDVGAGTMYVSGGVLRQQTNGAKLFYRPKAIRQADQRVTLKLNTGATVVSSAIAVVLKRLDASNSIFAQLNPSTGVLSINKYESGAYSASLAAATTTALATNTSYWLRASILGNQITVERFNVDPTGVGAVPVSPSVSFTLTGAEATKWGAGVIGRPGLRFDAVPIDYSFDDFRVEPLTLAGNVESFTIRNTGNFNALPIVRVYGYVENPIVKNNTTGKTFSLNMTIAEGDYVDIDFRNRTVEDKNGLSQYGKVPITSEFFGLQPQHLGDNEISVSATASRGVAPALRVYHRDTWV